jgi:Cys-rich repeat protein
LSRGNDVHQDPTLHLRLRLLGIAALAAGLLLSGCRDTSQTTGTGCAQDSDCGQPTSAYRCETQTGVCYCRTNDACPPRQFCNIAGFCQDKSGCEKNEDCIDPTLFCDTSTGTCLSKGRCTNDLHCPLGQVCDAARSLCVEGCREDGDCPGVSCRCGDLPCGCEGETTAERQACAIGVCDPTFCSTDAFCPYMSICGIPPGSTSARTECYTDYDPNRRPYCDNCSFGGSIQPCGTGPNYCLVDTVNPGNSFCGADCSDGQACPNGFGCSDVIVVGLPGTASCSAANPSCPANQNLPCVDDTECPRGGVCAKLAGQANGFCAGRCAMREGASQGFCTCLETPDCGQETCSMGECSISRRPCVTEQDCRAIRCVDFHGAGGCLIGQNCAPSQGLTCLNLRQ